MLAPFDDGTPPLLDAWDIAHPGEPHASTFSIYKRPSPASRELHCDFIFVSESCVPRVASSSSTSKTQASDHQPVILTLG